MSALELLHHVFPWEVAPGIAQGEESAPAEAAEAASPAPGNEHR